MSTQKHYVKWGLFQWLRYINKKGLQSALYVLNNYTSGHCWSFERALEIYIDKQTPFSMFANAENDC
jgi:hypothetical protein